MEKAKALLERADREGPDAERLLKIAQVALMANLSERTVLNDIKANRLPARAWRLRCRTRYRIALSDAKRYIAAIELRQEGN